MSDSTAEICPSSTHSLFLLADCWPLTEARPRTRCGKTPTLRSTMQPSGVTEPKGVRCSQRVPRSLTRITVGGDRDAFRPKDQLTDGGPSVAPELPSGVVGPQFGAASGSARFWL